MTRQVRLIGLLAAALPGLLAGPSAAAILTIGQGSAAPGAQASIPISYQGEPASSVQFTLDLSRSEPGGAPPLVANPVPTPGTTPIVDLNVDALVSATGLAQAESGALKAGVLMTIKLTVPSSVKEGTVYSLAVSGAVASGPQGETVPLQTVAGTVTVRGSAVKPPTLTVLEVIPGDATLVVGDTQQFQVSGLDGEKSPYPVAAVTWKASPEDLAQIDQNGSLTAVKPGVVTLSATSEGVTGTAKVTIQPPGGQAPPGAVAAGSVSGPAGSVVSVPITLEGPASLSELDLVLALADPKPPPLSIASVSAAEGTGVQLDTSLPNQASVVLLAGEAALTAGAVATLSVSIPDNPAPSYNLAPVVLRALDTSGAQYVLPGKVGTLTVTGLTPPPTRGDANGDGVTDVRDVIIAIRFVIRLATPTPTQMEAVDQNKDGRLDIGDVLVIIRLLLNPPK